jgi:hypothetical protein
MLAGCNQGSVTEVHKAFELKPTSFGTSSYDEARGLAKHSTGVYVVGQTSGNLHGTNQGDSNGFISKYSSSGSLMWGRQFGTPAFETVKDVASDSSNNAYAVGYTGERAVANPYVRKYTSSGEVAWARQFGTSSADFAYSVAVYGSSVYVVGPTAGSLAESKGGTDAFILKYNASGSVVWTRQFGTSADDYARDVAVDGSGNVYMVGDTDGILAGSSYGGMFIRKYNSSGSALWTKQGSDYYSYYTTSVAASGSNVYLVGSKAYDGPSVRVIKYSSAGSISWTKAYTDFTVYRASADSSGNLFLSGHTTKYEGSEVYYNRSYVTKISSEGSRIWSRKFGRAFYDNLARAVLARTSSEVYIAGHTSTSGDPNAFLTRLGGSSGNTVWSK